VSRAAAHVAPPRLVYVAIAIAALVGVLLVTTVGRDPTATDAARTALFVQAGLSLLLAAIHRDPVGPMQRAVQIAVMVMLGALTGVLAWFFGPQSGFSAFIAAMLIAFGLLTRGAAVKWPHLVGWSVFGAIALGQATVVVLVVSGKLPDASLVPVFLESYGPWKAVFAHGAMQAIYLAAFLSGRVLQRRANELTQRIDEAVRVAAHREALLDEARAEYRRALAVGKVSARIPVDETGETRVSMVPATSTRASTGSAWQQAFQSKMVAFHWLIIGFAVIGALLIVPVIRERAALYVALAAMAGIVAIVLIARRRGWVYQHWAVVAVLTIGPLYALGFPSALPAVITIGLFAGGLFSSAQRDAWRTRRGLVLGALIVSHSLAFGLVLAGIIPDLGNAPIRAPGQPTGHVVLQHVLLMVVYLATYGLTVAIDRRFDALTQRAEAATREAAQKAALLTTAREDLAQLLAGERRGIFSGLLVGPYEVSTLLGRGSMGEVYEANRAGVRAALKVVRGEVVSDAFTLGMFVTEAEALRRIKSPHVAQLYDTSAIGSDLPYIAMEYIEGPSLTDILRARRRLSLPELRALIAEIGRALDDAHRAGVVHRDIKPSNVIHATTAEGATWKLVDFGVALLLDVPESDTFVGTATYMAPEQALGEAVDARADLYSFSLVVYRAMTGRPAFTSPDPLEVARIARSVGVPDPLAVAPDLPPRLVAALMRGLAPYARDRYQSARELCAAFEAAFT
jgi:predicted Ser/Thr protein kinase